MRKRKGCSININGRLMDLSSPKVMGILNVTPDSFYSESRTFREDEITGRVERMLEEGVDIIDIGGCSTRPGFQLPEESEEMERVGKGCRIVRDLSAEIPLSVDTFRANIAKEAIKNWNVSIINDISGGSDPDMWPLVAEEKVAYVLTHNCETQPPYNDITAEVITELSKKINELHRLGVNDLIIDPGFGFAKTLDENLILFGEIEEIVKIGLPLLVGISRKSMIYKSLGIEPSESLNGTIALDAIALEKGANILRVHDVRPAVETVKLYNMINRSR